METSSTPRVLLRSLLFSYLLSGILLVITSFVLYKFRLKESQVKMAVNAIYLLSCALAGFLMGKGLRDFSAASLQASPTFWYCWPYPLSSTRGLQPTPPSSLPP